jgi:hypothetical protein
MDKAVNQEERLAYDVPEYGRKWGLNRNASYAAANRGDLASRQVRQAHEDSENCRRPLARSRGRLTCRRAAIRYTHPR